MVTKEKDDLDFKILESKLKSIVGIDNFNLDILKVLNLYSKDGYYTFAGELFADKNEMEFSGIDIIRYGKDTNQIFHEETLSNRSLLLQYNQAMEIFERYYQYEEIEGYERVKKEFVPRAAFSEALVNAIVQRDWEIKSPIHIAMHESRIEISSPGCLPTGISGANYLNSGVPVLRNPIIAGLFYRLKLTESFGACVQRTISDYEDSITKPTFRITDKKIRATLPVKETDLSNLSEDELIIYKILEVEYELSLSELDRKTGFNKGKTLRVLNSLTDRNFANKIGDDPGATYALA